MRINYKIASEGETPAKSEQSEQQRPYMLDSTPRSIKETTNTGNEFNVEISRDKRREKGGDMVN